MKAYRVIPYLRSDLWGGERLMRYGKQPADGGIVSESWELSFVPGCNARLADGRPLGEAFGREAFGERCEKFPFFPVLTKFIDARRDLSVQVHPSDEYALRNEGQYGKSEMWYIMEAEEGAGLYLGMKECCTAEKIRADAMDGSIENDLHFQPVKAGDVYLLPPGTVHAIGAGVLLFEIQQNSTLTYRLYDYKRRDKDGNERPLHLEKALKVAKLCPYTAESPNTDDPTVIGRTAYFETRLFKELFTKSVEIDVTDCFWSFSVVRGEGTIDGQKCGAGDTFFVPAHSGAIVLHGDMDVIGVTVGADEN